MKLKILIALIILTNSFSIREIYSQAGFTAGKIRITLNEFGNIQLRIPSERIPLNIYRTSILAGVSPTEVFDYFNDSDNEDTVMLDTLNEFSDYRIYGEFNNDDSNLPPEIIVKTEIFGWKNALYALLRFNIQNKTDAPLNVIPGLEIIPQIGGTPETDTVGYLADQDIIDIFEKDHIGFKLLSNELRSLKTFEYFDGYENDSSFYSWLTYGAIDQFYTSNDTTSDDGAVIITSQDPVFLNVDDSVIVYYAIAFGDSMQQMTANMNRAESKYLILTSAWDEKSLTVNSFILHQNHPNPFNPSTTIEFQLPKELFAELKVFDILGREISIIAQGYFKSGSYKFIWDASHLSSGIYFYNLSAGSSTETKKMMLVR
jgi:hypothetical protein